MAIVVVLSIARKRYNLTQEKLARLSDRSQQLIGKLEQGKAKGIGFDTLNQLCKVTGGKIWDVIVYVPDDPQLIDETLNVLAKRLRCSTEEIFLYLPVELKQAYWRLNRGLS
ncbi:MAG: helix-turn-helix domain-containing protein [Cyanobacteria bacterium SBLK]|nr:helix-turn-helix domain-containing protein [Cyanobacteria bacterium SBLK]